MATETEAREYILNRYNHIMARDGPAAAHIIASYELRELTADGVITADVGKMLQEEIDGIPMF